MAETMTPRMKALQNLSSALPVTNQRVAQGQAAARDIQLQQAVQKAPPKANITQAAQQTGASSAQQTSQQLVERAGQQIQQQGQIGQLGAQEQGRAADAKTFGLSQGAKEEAMGNVQKLAQISEEAKQEVYDQQMSFEKDEAGRALFNDRQLADYAKLNAQDDEQYKNYAQQSDQLSKRKLQAMEHASNVVNADLNQRYMEAKQKGDQKTMLEVNQIKKDMEEKIQKERNKAANRQAAWTAGGAIIGGVAGAIFGGPAGAAAGASVGSAAGGMIGSQTE